MSNEYAGKRVLVVETFGSANPERGPFVFAGEASRGGAEVFPVFVLQAPLLLKRGIAEKLHAKPGGRNPRIHRGCPAGWGKILRV